MRSPPKAHVMVSAAPEPGPRNDPTAAIIAAAVCSHLAVRSASASSTSAHTTVPVPAPVLCAQAPTTVFSMLTWREHVSVPLLLSTYSTSGLSQQANLPTNSVVVGVVVRLVEVVAEVVAVLLVVAVVDWVVVAVVEDTILHIRAELSGKRKPPPSPPAELIGFRPC